MHLRKHLKHGFYGMKSLVLKHCQHVFRNILGQLAEAAPQAVTVTREEREAIERVRFLSFQCNQSRNDCWTSLVC